MLDFSLGIFEKWRNRKIVRAQAVLDGLKARYHTFRILLANNDLSLDLLKTVEQLLASPKASRENLSDTVDELLNVTYELVDGLNRLTGNRNSSLYQGHRVLSDSIRHTLGAFMSKPSHAPLVMFFDDFSLEFQPEVGGKAASLAFLKGAGFPVPDGFVVTAKACWDSLSESGVHNLVKRKFQLMEARNRAAEMEKHAAEVRERILEAKLPRFLEDEVRGAYERLTSPDNAAISVRSSGLVEDKPEHSFAGQFKSILNVTSFDMFETAFKEVLASNFSTRAETYREHAGLPPARNDMAVICQRMVPARAGGVLFTIDPASPASGRMLISAVPGLGSTVVSGAVPADLYKPLREGAEKEPAGEWTRIAEKTGRVVVDSGGGVREEEVPADERERSVLSEPEVLALVRFGRKIESLAGAPQDIEWAVSPAGEISILQSREVRIVSRQRQTADSVRGPVIMRGGVCSSPGRCVGVVKVIHSLGDLQGEGVPPTILVLHQSMVDAARLLPGAEGVIVDVGNPTDHLSCVAREYGRPMITGLGNATEILRDGQWIILDADRRTIHEAPEDAWADPEGLLDRQVLPQKKRRSVSDPPVPELAKLRELIEPLNLTDAYGPTFSIRECKSLHDVIRYVHETAVLAMFDAGDEILEDAEVLVHRLSENIPIHVMLIDLGGGLAAGKRGFRIGINDVVSVPFQAFWKGVMTPGLRWSTPPPAANLSGLLSRAMLDGRSGRPVGQQNYALITRDYLNLNARLDYHFTMVDTVCGRNPRENYVRFRFKGGGTNIVHRERRTRFIAEILTAHDFFIDMRGDLLTASLTEMHSEELQEKLLMIGRLTGFTRLLDATMTDDAMPARVARAFLEGDYGLDGLGQV